MTAVYGHVWCFWHWPSLQCLLFVNFAVIRQVEYGDTCFAKTTHFLTVCIFYHLSAMRDNSVSSSYCWPCNTTCLLVVVIGQGRVSFKCFYVWLQWYLWYMFSQYCIHLGVLLMVVLGVAVGIVVGALLLCVISHFTHRSHFQSSLHTSSSSLSCIFVTVH